MALQVGKAALLDDVIDHIKYLQYQVKVNFYPSVFSPWMKFCTIKSKIRYFLKLLHLLLILGKTGVSHFLIRAKCLLVFPVVVGMSGMHRPSVCCLHNTCLSQTSHITAFHFGNPPHCSNILPYLSAFSNKYINFVIMGKSIDESSSFSSLCWQDYRSMFSRS